MVVKAYMFDRIVLFTVWCVVSNIVLLDAIYGQDQSEKKDDLAGYVFVRDKNAIETSLWYVVMDLGCCELQPKKFAELKTLASKKSSLKALLDRMKNGKDSVALAVFFNQLYPDKRFVPTVEKFSIRYPNPIPVEICSNGGSLMVNVTPEVFGEICFFYWSDRLNIDDHPIPSVKAGADKNSNQRDKSKD